MRTKTLELWLTYHIEIGLGASVLSMVLSLFTPPLPYPMRSIVLSVGLLAILTFFMIELGPSARRLWSSVRRLYALRPSPRTVNVIYEHHELNLLDPFKPKRSVYRRRVIEQLYNGNGRRNIKEGDVIVKKRVLYREELATHYVTIDDNPNSARRMKELLRLSREELATYYDTVDDNIDEAKRMKELLRFADLVVDCGFKDAVYVRRRGNEEDYEGNVEQMNVGRKRLGANGSEAIVPDSRT